MDKQIAATEARPFVFYESDGTATRCCCVMGNWSYDGLWRTSRRAARNELKRAFASHGMAITFKSGRKPS